MELMEKTLLVAGKEIPDGGNFVAGAVTSGRKTVVSKSSQNENVATPSGSSSYAWNRPSALSARSLVLKALTELGNIDECVIYFDETYFLKQYDGIDNAAENVRVIEELISSYQYLTMEIISKIQKQIKNQLQTSSEKRNLRLVFLHKTNISLSESILTRSTSKASTPFLTTASQAFKAYAENVAATLIENEDITPLLVNCSMDNEFYENDNALAMWLFGYLNQLYELKRPLSPKQKLSWVKAGTKTPGGFGFFG